MGSEPDVVGSAATATGDDIVAAGLFTLTGRSGATDSTVIGQRRGRGLRISRSGGIGAHSAADPAEGGHASSSPSARSGSTCSAPPATNASSSGTPSTGDGVATTIHARLDVRTVTLEDTWTGERYELEGERSPRAHVTATMRALSDVDEIAS